MLRGCERVNENIVKLEVYGSFSEETLTFKVYDFQFGLVQILTSAF